MNNIRQRITWIFGLFIALAMISVVSIVGYRLHASITQSLQQDLEDQARQDARALMQRIDYLLESAHVLVKNPLLINGLNDPQGRETYLPELVRNFREGRDVHAVALLAFDGKPVFSSLEKLPTFADSKELRSTLASGLSSYTTDRENGLWVLFIPVFYYNTTQGALVVVFDLKAATRHTLATDALFARQLSIGQQVIYREKSLADTDLLVARRALSRGNADFLNALDLHLEVATQREHFLAPARTATRDIAILGLLLTLIAITIAYAIGYSISRPIVWLRQRVAAADGTPEKSCAPLGTHDELDELAEMFDQRTRELREIQQHLEDMVASRTRELEVAKVAAEDASRFKSSFLANMSHEIRTPMNAIVGLTHLIRRAETDPKQIDHLDKITQAAQHLLSIINDILDFSKIEAGKLNIETTDFVLDRVFHNLNDLISERAAEKHLELINRIDPRIPAQLHGDPLRLGQILLNFASNAVKFTESGNVVFSAVLLDQQDDIFHVRFEVRDTGIGLSPEQSSQLFQAFVQADASTTRKFGGTGLGLAISKRLVELLGGRIGVDSALGRGSTFWFELPLRAAQDSEPAPARHYSPHNLRALVVDDNADARVAMEDMLQTMHARVDLADSGEQALALLRRLHEQHETYDLILMDWSMPGMDGIETSRQIRTIDGNAQILLVTAFGRDWTDEQLQSAGIAGQLAKPLTASLLNDAIESLFQRIAYPTSGTAAARDLSRLHGRRILLAEDNPVNQEIALDLLREEGGLIVDLANDGVEAVAMARATDYELVLMDIQMPHLDGLAATRELRKMPQYARTPILAMTANAFDEDRQACLDAGMDDHVGKPVDPDKLFAMLLHWLPAQAPVAVDTTIDTKTAMPDAAASGTAPAPTSQADLASLLAAIPGIDIARGLQAVRGKWPTYTRLLKLFASTHADDASSIRAALENGQPEVAQRLAHSLKSAAGNLGLVTIQHLAESIEMPLKAGLGDAMALATKPLGELESVLPEVLGQLQTALAAAEHAD